MQKGFLLFSREYRIFSVNPILIPNILNENRLIISVAIKSRKNYKSVGRIDEILVSSVRKEVVASSQILREGTQLLTFNNEDKYRLKIYPNYYIEKLSIAIITTSKIVPTMSLLRALIPKSYAISCPANTYTKLLEYNPKRTAILFRTINDPVVLATGLNDLGQPIATLDDIKTNSRLYLEESISGIYKGEIWGITPRLTTISITEYSAQ